MSLKEKASPWQLRAPEGKADDQLYNRRLLSYYALAFTAIWVHEVLVVIVIGMYLKAPLDAGVVAALVGVPVALSGLGFWKYLEAAKASDQSATPSTTSPINVENAESVTIQAPPTPEGGPTAPTEPAAAPAKVGD